MGLQSIPTELQLQIFSLVERPRDRLSVARTCRELFAIIEPILYSTFRQENGNAGPQFLKRLLERPDLARYFRFVSVQEPDNKSINSNLPQTALEGQTAKWPIIEAHLTDYIEVVGEIMPVAPAEVQVAYWSQSIADPNRWDLFASTLLNLLPNIEKLDISSRENACPGMLAALRIASELQNRALESPYSLAKLCEIVIGSWDNDNVILQDINCIAPVLQMPSLRTFVFSGILDTPLHPTFLKHSIHIENLRLEKCGVSGDDIHHLLLRCKSLKHFHFGFSKPRSKKLNSNQFFRSFKNLHEKLETLILLDEDDWNESSSDIKDRTPLPCISEFTKLYSIEISCQFLLDKQIFKSPSHEATAGTAKGRVKKALIHAFKFADFPNSLVDLIVRNTNIEIVVALLEDLVNSPVDVLPKLKSIRMQFTDEKKLSVDLATWTELSMKLWKTKGVQLSFNFSMYLNDNKWIVYYP